jgi:hypothetical protein
MGYSHRLYGLISLVTLAVNGCAGGGESSGPAPEQQPPTQSATLSVGSATILVGGSVPRKAWLGFTLVQPTWRSLNPAIATISSTGVVTGVVAGTATIEATSGQNRGTAEITVADLRFTQLDVNGRHACARAAGGTWYCWGGNGIEAPGPTKRFSRALPFATRGMQHNTASSRGDAGIPEGICRSWRHDVRVDGARTSLLLGKG